MAYALDYIPLAITQAAAYINRRAPRITISGYLKEFHKNDKKKANLLEGVPVIFLGMKAHQTRL